MICAKPKSLAVLVAVLALVGAVFAPRASAQAAPVLAEAVPSVSAQAAAKLVQSLKADVDGDGHADTVRVYRLSTHKFRVTVKTRKKTVTRTVTTSKDSTRLTKPLYAAASLDGAKGKELIVLTGNPGDISPFFSAVVLTWRKGALASEKGPHTWTEDEPWTDWGWFSNSDDAYRVSYRFFTTKGKRYVDASFVEAAEAQEWAGHWSGWTRRSVWKSGAWKYQRTIHIPDQTGDMPPGGFLGVKLIKGD